MGGWGRGSNGLAVGRGGWMDETGAAARMLRRRIGSGQGNGRKDKAGQCRPVSAVWLGGVRARCSARPPAVPPFRPPLPAQRWLFAVCPTRPPRGAADTATPPPPTLSECPNRGGSLTVHWVAATLTAPYSITSHTTFLRTGEPTRKISLEQPSAAFLGRWPGGPEASSASGPSGGSRDLTHPQETAPPGDPPPPPTTQGCA